MFDIENGKNISNELYQIKSKTSIQKIIKYIMKGMETLFNWEKKNYALIFEN